MRQLVVNRRRIAQWAALLLLLWCGFMESVSAQAAPPALSALAPEQREQVKSLMRQGQAALRQGNAQAAARAFVSALKIDPTIGDGYYHLAIISFQRGDYKQGLRLINKAVELMPNSVMPRMAFARALSEVGEFDMALRQLAAVKAIVPGGSPTASEVLRQEKLIALKQFPKKGSREMLKPLADELVAQRFGDVNTLHGVGTFYVNAGYLDEAKRVFERLIELKPKHQLYLMGLASVYEKRQEFPAALDIYKQVVSVRSDSPPAKQAKLSIALLMGGMYQEKGDFDLSLQEYKKALEIEPTNIRAGMNVGMILSSRRSYDEAIEYFKVIVDSYPDFLEARYRMMLAYVDKKDMPAGVRELDYLLAASKGTSLERPVRALSDDMERQMGDGLKRIRGFNRDLDELSAKIAQVPDSAQLRSDLADLYLTVGGLAEAEKYYKEALELDPKHGHSHARLASFFQQQRKLDDALESYRSALLYLGEGEEFDRAQRMMLLLIGQMGIDERAFDKAIEAFEQILAKDPEDSKALTGMAQVYSGQGELEVAVEWYLKLLAKEPEDLESRIRLALLYERLNEEELAVEHYTYTKVSENLAERMRTFVDKRLEYVQRKINGFSYSLNYSIDADAQVGESTFDYRSTTGGAIDYNYRLLKHWRFSAVLQPMYITYHKGQVDFLNVVFSPSFENINEHGTTSVGLDRSSQFGVLREDQSVTVTRNVFLGHQWTTEEGGFYNTRLSLRGFLSETNPFFDADTYTLSFSASERWQDHPITYGYSFVSNQNKQDLGNDYAYNSHAVNGSLSRFISEDVSYSMNASASILLYSNPDSGTEFSKKRRNMTLTLGGRVNYRFDDSLSLFASYSYYVQESNLEVGFVLDPVQIIEGRQAVVARQSASLGSMDSHSFGAGVRMRF